MYSMVLESVEADIVFFHQHHHVYTHSTTWNVCTYLMVEKSLVFGSGSFPGISRSRPCLHHHVECVHISRGKVIFFGSVPGISRCIPAPRAMCTTPPHAMCTPRTKNFGSVVKIRFYDGSEYRLSFYYCK